MTRYAPHLRFLAACALAGAALALAVSLTSGRYGRTPLGPPLGPDFVGFYAAADTLNRGEPGRLYDGDHQDRVQRETLPDLPGDFRLPYLHPPFVAWLLRPLAALPYPAAYLVWLTATAALFAAALRLLGTLEGCATVDRRTGLLLAASFPPFLMECALGGQLSAFGFFLLALAARLDLAGRPLLAGLALGGLAYKPTLLALAIPALLAARRWPALLTAAATGGALAGFCWLALPEASAGYLDRLTGFAGSGTLAGGLTPPLPKYVDLSSFWRLLTGAGPEVTRPLLLLSALPPLLLLAREARHLGRAGAAHAQLVWAAVLTGTPAVNVYAGAYDATPAVGGILLSLAAGAPAAWKWGAVLWLTAWLSQPLAQATGVQILTLALLAVTALQLAEARRRRESP